MLREIQSVQELLDQNQSDELLSKEEMLLKEMDVVLEQEETIWFQKTREKWVVHRDRNTKFFQTSTIIWRCRNRIEMLKDDESTWISNRQELEALAVAYYKRLYSLEDVDPMVDKLPSRGFVSLFGEDGIKLSRPFSEAKIEKAIQRMGQFKAPGPDGFQPVFYQKCW